MRDETEFPRLTPSDDRYLSSDGLFRKPEDLTDGQFDLLAAAWSEGALSGEQLSELEEVLNSSPVRKTRAESFRKVKLVPYDEKWPGRNRMLKQSHGSPAIRRIMIITAAAAALISFIMLGPATIRRALETRNTPLPKTGLTAEARTTPLPETAIMAEALIPEARPVIIPARPAETMSAETALAEPGQEIVITRETDHIISDMRPAPETPVLTTASALAVLSPVEMKPAGSISRQAQISEAEPATDREQNWILRSVSFLVKAITGEEKKIDGYFIASACVKSINNTLGWEMELKKTSNPDGEPVAVNFSSSLLSVSAPVSKNSP